MTIALGKFTKDENDLFDIMDDWLRRGSSKEERAPGAWGKLNKFVQYTSNS